MKLTAEERTWLDQHPDKLILLFNTTFPPIEFSSGAGEFTGMGADIIAIIEKRLGVTFIKRPADNWNDQLFSLESGACAIVPTIVATPERQRYAFFTTAYASIPVVIVTNNAIPGEVTLDGLAGRRVAVVSGYAAEKYLRDVARGRFEVVPVSSVTEGLRSVSVGPVDAFVENISVAIYYIDKEGIPNLRLAGNTDYTYAFSIGVSRQYPLLYSAIQKALGSISESELKTVHKRWVSMNISGWLDPETRHRFQIVNVLVLILLFALLVFALFLWFGIKKKVTGLKVAQQELLEQNELMRLATEATHAGVWDCRPTTDWTIYLSEEWWAMLGYAGKDRTLSLNEFERFVHPDDLPALSRFFAGYISSDGKGRFEYEFRLRRADDAWCWVMSRGMTVERDEKGIASRVIGLDVNIQHIKEARETLSQSEERFRMLFKMAPLALVSFSRDGNVFDVNDQMTRITGYTMDDIRDLKRWQMVLHPDPDRRKNAALRWQDALERALAKGSDVEPHEYLITCKDGTERTMIVGANIIGDTIIASYFDVTERRAEELALQQSMSLMRATLNATTDGILVVNKEFKVTQANQQFYEMWRIPPDFPGRDDDVMMREFVLDQLQDPAGFQVMAENLYRSKVRTRHEIYFKDGRVFESYSAPVVMVGTEVGRVWDVRDITESKRAEAERKRLQDQLLQSQKMEAIGVLAGGVAHDFNNMLGAIIGYAELTIGKMTSEDPFRRNLERILDAARCSANITRQLLAFARKQAIAPVALDLNASVESTLKMLRRLIGENIELVWLPGSGPCFIKMDPSQLDQILLNLCVNAKDAIAGVGRVTIETDVVSVDQAYCASHAESAPGNYVLLSVSDTGCGMDQETRNRIFEPFFTTKGLGRGTGMGLATIYGIVKQNKGFVNVYSEPGAGTTLKIYIPLTSMDAETAKTVTDDIPLSRGETILLVEDDPILLEMSMAMLESLGYTVLSAATPQSAIGIVRESSVEIHLFITDVVMPEMNGRELVERLLTIRPQVQCLFMSGYPADVIAHQGILEEGVHFLLKPFSVQALGTKVREVLG